MTELRLARDRGHGSHGWLAFVYAGLFDGEERAACPIGEGRLGYLHVARGNITANGVALGPGDALKSGPDDITLSGGRNAEVIAFNLPE